MTVARIVLRGAKEITFANSRLQLKDEGRIIAVFDHRYRIVAEFPSHEIDSFSEERYDAPACVETAAVAARTMLTAYSRRYQIKAGVGRIRRSRA